MQPVRISCRFASADWQSRRNAEAHTPADSSTISRSSGIQSFSIPPPDTPEVVRPPSGLQPAAMLYARWSGIHGSAYFVLILLSGRVGGEAKALAMRSKAIER